MTNTLYNAQHLIPRLIDFREIDANNYDEWEQFSECLLREMGYVVVQPPGRGADGGKDMVVADCSDTCKYIVSCKHFANRGKAVGCSEEQNILDRVRSAGANGFIGAYSSLASQALIDRLWGLKQNGDIVEFKILQPHNIEQFLLQKGCSGLVSRYFPKSYCQSRMAGNLWRRVLPLKCSACGRDLLSIGDGWIMWAEETIGGVDQVLNLGCACKGTCIDRVEAGLYATYNRSNVGVMSEELSWCNSPLGYWIRHRRIMNAIHSGRVRYSLEAWENECEIDAALAQCVMRNVSEEDRRIGDILVGMEEI